MSCFKDQSVEYLGWHGHDSEDDLVLVIITEKNQPTYWQPVVVLHTRKQNILP